MKVSGKPLTPPTALAPAGVSLAPAAPVVSLAEVAKALAQVAPKPVVPSSVASANQSIMAGYAPAFAPPDPAAHAFATRAVDAMIAAKQRTEARRAEAEGVSPRPLGSTLLRLLTRWLPTHLAIAGGADENLKGKAPEVVADRQRLSSALLAVMTERLLEHVPLQSAIDAAPRATGALLAPKTDEAKAALAGAVAFAEKKQHAYGKLGELKEAARRGFELSPIEAQLLKKALGSVEDDPDQALKTMAGALARLDALLRPTVETKKPTKEELAQLRKDLKSGATEDKKLTAGKKRLEALIAEVKDAPEPSRTERFRGAMIGLAIGDALGGPTEFMDRESLRRKHGLVTDMIGGGWLDLQPGEYTDDTQMAEAMAKAIVKSKGFDASEIQKNWIAWLDTDPKDVGGLTRDALELARIGVPAELSGQIPWVISGFENAGNGSVMRAAPVALLTAGKPEDEIEAKAIASSAITHSDPRCTYGTAAIAVGLSAIMDGEADVLGKVIEYLAPRSPALAESLKKIPTLDAEDLRTSGYVVDTVQAAFWALHHAKSYPEGIVIVSNLGEDTDTAGATAGILLGARFGIAGIPESWRDQLQNRSGLEALAGQIQKLNEAKS